MAEKKLRIRIFRKLLHAIEFLLVLDLLNPSMILTIFYCLFSRMVVLQSLKTRGTPHLVKWTFLDIFFLSPFFLYRYLSTFFKRKKYIFYAITPLPLITSLFYCTFFLWRVNLLKKKIQKYMYMIC